MTWDLSKVTSVYHMLKVSPRRWQIVRLYAYSHFPAPEHPLAAHALQHLMQFYCVGKPVKFYDALVKMGELRRAEAATHSADETNMALAEMMKDWKWGMDKDDDRKSKDGK